MTTPVLSDAALRRLRDGIDWPDVGARFEVRAMIGQGGMGRVYRVWDRQLERELALKVLSLDAETPTLARRLSREARVLARLEHPGIVAIHDAGTLSDGRPYYLMRLVRGQNLTEALSGTGRGERLRIFLRVCDAVAFAHARGVVHRDLKPANVMLGEFGEVVVLDWGVAKLLEATVPEPETLANATARGAVTDDATADGVVVGTPGFMAPEQADGITQAIDGRADIFGLGALLRWLLETGPQADTTRGPLAAIANCAMAGDPNARYQRVEALADEVRRWLDADPVSAYDESLLERTARFIRRNRTLLLLLLAYAVVRITILLWRGV